MPEAPTGVSSSDEGLVPLTRGRDRSAREELFRRHWGIAYRLLGHEKDALDAVQDGLPKAVTHLDDSQGRSGFHRQLEIRCISDFSSTVAPRFLT
jgi:RNA polymerase sigma-70 factor (ECF subfamily)